VAGYESLVKSNGGKKEKRKAESGSGKKLKSGKAETLKS